MHFRQIALISILTTLLWGIGTPSAVADNMQKAEEIYGQAVESYKQKEYDTALEGFKEAYNLSGKSAILYNLAICHEKLDQTDHAIAYYELYLEENPDVEDAEAVSQKVAFLKDPKSSPDPEAPPAESTKASSKGPKYQPASQPKTQGSQRPLQVITPPDPQEHKIQIAQGLLIGTGSLIFATGGLTAIAAYKKYDSFEAICAPNCSNDQVSKVRHLSIAADIQMGVGLVAVTTGLVWLILHKKKKNRLSNAALRGWHLNPKLAHDGNGISISRRF